MRKILSIIKKNNKRGCENKVSNIKSGFTRGEFS